MKNIFAILAVLLITTFAARADSAASTPAPAVAPAAQAAGAPAGEAPAPPAPAPVQAEAPAPKRKEDEISAAGTPVTPGLLDRIKAALSSNKNVAELHAQITALTSERENALIQNAALKLQINALTTERNTAIADITKITALLDGQRDIVKATAAEIASTVGQPLAALPAPLGEEAGGSIFEKWQEAKGAEKTRLFRAHREEIRAEAKRRGAQVNA